MGRILINCDLGENEPDSQTARLLALVDAANICCGAHAGSQAKTRRTIRLAKEQGVLIGAHPGLPAAGGRGHELPTTEACRGLLMDQLHSFLATADCLKAPVSYVKLHGSLYHAVEQAPAYAQACLEVLKATRRRLGVFALAGGVFQRQAKAAGLEVWQEAFADRAYRRDGSLLPRAEPGATLKPDAALTRLKRWLREGKMESADGGQFQLRADTLCAHSDSPGAEELLAGVRQLFDQT